ncbi:cobalamin biosynthesis protein CobQ [Candidatus Gottesmanbacteria bacterium]|nr:cobalamin biosynthesis protein CobQ [Candidatus Gottesmanbacteria bacterium]
MNKLSLTILWMYPDLMSTYGDRGNIIVLTKRSQWRGIVVNIIENGIEKADLIFMGGAQDRQQKIVSRDLFSKKGEILRQKIEEGVPGLFICGAYQFLGHYYLPAEGDKIPGLSIFDAYTRHYGLQKPRAIGNIVIDWNGKKLVGFENHGGRTYLGKKVRPFGLVLKGYGNNGEDKTEGAVYKNAYGTYLHGPILPKNPEFADFLIQKALEVKYKKEIKLKSLDNSLEQQAKKSILQKIV